MRGLVIRSHVAAVDVFHQGTSILDMIAEGGGAGGSAIVLPVQINTPTYNGQEHRLDMRGFNPLSMTLGGTQTATAAGTYEATITPKPGCAWKDTGGTEARTVTWQILHIPVNDIVQDGDLYFTGETQTPEWTGLDPEIITLTGVTEAANAGVYQVTATLQSNYAWRDGSTSPRAFTWQIQRTAGVASLSHTSVTLDADCVTQTITVSRDGNGEITAESSDPDIVMVRPGSEAGTFKLIGRGSGSATVTVTVAEGTNHLAVTDLTIAVEVGDVPTASPVLAENDPDVIALIVQTGQASNYWKVGDTMPRTLNGTVGGYKFNNFQALDVVLDFDHNAEIEGSNTMMMGLCWKTANGATNIGLCNAYNTTCSQGAAGFYMNPQTSTDTYGTTQGGWRDSYMRTTLMPQFYSAIADAAFRAIIAEHTVYTSNGAKEKNNTLAEVTATNDRVYLLSEFEVFGACTYSNSFEQQFQTQVEYFKNGNNRVAYNHTSTGSAVVWDERSPVAAGVRYFCMVGTSGSASHSNARNSRAVRAVYVIS